MPRQKLEVSIPAFKVTPSMKSAITDEIELDPREQHEMIRTLLAEALSFRQAKRTIKKFLL